MPEIEPGLPCKRQVLYLLYYHPGPYCFSLQWHAIEYFMCVIANKQNKNSAIMYNMTGT